MSAFDWWPDWSGQTCLIVASGPSAKTAGVDLAKGRAKVIAINNSWRLAPWADALYGCDFTWWHANRGVPEFAGLKISQDQRCRKPYRDIRLIDCDRGYERRFLLNLEKRGLVGWGGNGGFQSLNLAAQFGAKKIVLVGYDMRIDLGVHWHGKHARGMNNPGAHHTRQWVAALDGVAPQLKAAGIEVLNASPVSALTAYPKVTLAEALA